MLRRKFIAKFSMPVKREGTPEGSEVPLLLLFDDR